MRTESPGEADLRALEAAELPEARAARRAYEWWVTYQRVWAAADRAGAIEPADRMTYIARRLWPDLRDELVAELASRAAVTGSPVLVSPSRPEAIVGERLVELMRTHGFLAAED